MRRRIAADICICLALFMAGWCAAEPAIRRVGDTRRGARCGDRRGRGGRAPRRGSARRRAYDGVRNRRRRESMPPCDTHFGRSVARFGRGRPRRRALPREALFAPFGAELRTLHGASRIRGAGDARPAKRGETHIRRSLFRQPPARAGRREDRAARVVARGRGSDPRRRRGRQVGHNARNATALFARGHGASARRVGVARRIRLRDSQFAVLVDASVAARTSVALRGGRGSDMALCLRDGFLAERDALGDHVHGVAGSRWG